MAHSLFMTSFKAWEEVMRQQAEFCVKSSVEFQCIYEEVVKLEELSLGDLLMLLREVLLHILEWRSRQTNSCFPVIGTAHFPGSERHGSPLLNGLFLIRKRGNEPLF